MVALLVVALALGLNNFGAAIAIGVSGVDRPTGLKVAAVFGLWDVVMPAAGLLIGHGLAGELGRAARFTGAGVLAATAVWGLVEAARGDDDAPQAWQGGGCWSAAPRSAWTTSRWGSHSERWPSPSSRR